MKEGNIKVVVNQDAVTDRIYNQISKEIAQKFGIELSNAAIHDVCSSQFAVVQNAFFAKQDIKLDYLGKFKIKPGRVYKIKENKKIKGKLFKVIVFSDYKEEEDF